MENGVSIFFDLEKAYDTTWNFVCRHIFAILWLSSDYPVVNSGGNQSIRTRREQRQW